MYLYIFNLFITVIATMHKMEYSPGEFVLVLLQPDS